MEVKAWLTDAGVVFTRTGAPRNDARGNGHYTVDEDDIAEQDAVYDMIAAYAGDSELDSTFVKERYNTDEADLLAEYNGVDLVIHVETIIEESTDEGVLSYFGIPTEED